MALTSLRFEFAALAALAVWAFLPGGAPVAADETSGAEVVRNSKFLLELNVPPDAVGEYLAFSIPPALFHGARWDLADLRLLDAGGKLVPHAVRIYLPRSQQQDIEARVFNRVSGEDGSAELSLDLGEERFDHNEVEIVAVGESFRRAAIVEGSDDAANWGKLAEARLLRFSTRRGPFQEQRVEYPTSRFRYLRVRVSPDPEVDSRPVTIESVAVRRTVDEPGVYITREARLGEREPTRHNGVFGSAWTIDVGGEQTPCVKLEVEIEGAEFARDYSLSPQVDSAAAGNRWGGFDYYYIPRPPPAYDDASGGAAPLRLEEALNPFTGASGAWRRRAGEPQVPLAAELGNVRCGKLRLFVADSANEPLSVKSVRYTAPECLVVFAHARERAGSIKVYFGDRQAAPPNYDFARNLPATLSPAPTMVSLEVPAGAPDSLKNPDYVPPPLPFTERFRWLIHCLLGAVSLLLAVLVALLARQAIRGHDARAAAQTASS